MNKLWQPERHDWRQQTWRTIHSQCATAAWLSSDINVILSSLTISLWDDDRKNICYGISCVLWRLVLLFWEFCGNEFLLLRVLRSWVNQIVYQVPRVLWTRCSERKHLHCSLNVVNWRSWTHTADTKERDVESFRLCSMHAQEFHRYAAYSMMVHSRQQDGQKCRWRALVPTKGNSWSTTCVLTSCKCQRWSTEEACNEVSLSRSMLRDQRFMYSHLRECLRAAGSWFLMPAGWVAHRGPVVLVEPRTSDRLERHVFINWPASRHRTVCVVCVAASGT